MTSLHDAEARSRARPSHKQKTETKAQRERRLKKGRAQRQQLRERLCTDDDAVLTFKEWCRINGISERNGRRILRGSDRPAIIQLSEHRIGIRRRDNRAWQEARAR
jgi:hypothetical protein